MIEICNLELSYEGEEKIFSSLSLKIEKNKPVLIISEPGCGKTSLAKALCGVGTRFYSMNVEGSFSYDSLDLLSLGVPERRSYVARSIQNVDEAVLFPTVSDEVAFPLEQRMLGRDVIEKELSSLLERYDLVRYHDADTSELSGGEKRLLSIALALAMSPDIILLDESLSGLDWKGYRAFRALVSSLKNSGIGIIFISHDPSILDLADALIVLKDGKIVFDGNPVTAMEDGLVKKSFAYSKSMELLGTPVLSLKEIIRRMENE